MKPLHIIPGTALSIALMAFPILAGAMKSGEEHKSDCIRDMKLTEELLSTHLYDYQVDRCVDFRVTREGNAQHLERLAARQKLFNENLSRRLREGERFITPETQERFRPEREATNLRARAFSRRQLYKDVEQITYQQSRENRSLVRQERMEQSREACQKVEKSFYPNCVRNTFRSLGESAKESSMPTTRRY